MKTVKEVSQLAGVSVRTLHYYHEIGLLCPTQVTDSGYRLYDDKALMRLQDILLFRELDVPLKKIAELMDSSQAVRQSVLRDHVRILELRRDRLETLVQLANDLIKGEQPMNLEAFNQDQLAAFQEEAQKRWGDTAAFQAFTETATDQDWQASNQELMTVFAGFGKLLDLPVTDPAVQGQVKALQDTITKHYYPCTDEILQGLGLMYVEDNRFTQTIDQAAGEGTARFVSEAIAFYTQA
ncbi:MerR family transcriptional regulator [Streptococcus ovuberis]|uniref:MerR family transcriptional regulator n=1 Tax=Streptococcus ovuberis TaxID=1936207 RepID=A0A7X6MWH6_9STRE|nr:MerR family transcriptional regulator [Streptococcus ovuberis]NKZ19662.1 MerR family transcriptional regulator [Streptococcus ovuberis]